MLSLYFIEKRMELELLQFLGGIAVGLILGVVAMLVFNKVKTGSASPAGVKQEFEDYKNEVEAHFEATSKKFQNMTEQYQDLYQHLSVGATSLCRPDSVAAALVDGSGPASKPAQLESKEVDARDDEANQSEMDHSSLKAEQSSKETEGKADGDQVSETGHDNEKEIGSDGAAEQDKRP